MQLQIPEEFIEHMNIHEYIQTLRLRLLDMARVSQRSVDYAVKAYTVGSGEFCANVRDCTDEINILHRETTEIARELLLIELACEPDLRFVLTSARICHALQAMHSQAVEIAYNSMRLVETGGLKCTHLATMGGVVNGLVRLCVVSLFDEGIQHARTVLRSDGVERLFQATFYDWYVSVDQRARTQAGFELAIAKHLSEIVRQTQEMADAIVFWLDNAGRQSLLDAGKRQHILRDTSLTAESLEITASDGMQLVLQGVDICFASSGRT